MSVADPPDDETLMAYADGELDPIAAKRVERALADNPALAARVDEQRALRERLAGAFGPIVAEPVPAALREQLALNVVPLQPPVKKRRWLAVAAVAAALVLGVGVGRQWQDATSAITGDRLAARGELARALDGELSGGHGATRILASFSATDGGYCRVFMTQAVAGIACHNSEGWAVRRVQTITPAATTAYRQAAAPAAEVMAAAQDMMAGDPLDPSAERSARDGGWQH